MFRLGVRAPGAEARHLHAPNFDLDEDALPLGTALLAQTTLRLLAARAYRIVCLASPAM